MDVIVSISIGAKDANESEEELEQYEDVVIPEEDSDEEDPAEEKVDQQEEISANDGSEELPVDYYQQEVAQDAVQDTNYDDNYSAPVYGSWSDGMQIPSAPMTKEEAERYLAVLLLIVDTAMADPETTDADLEEIAVLIETARSETFRDEEDQKILEECLAKLAGRWHA